MGDYFCSICDDKVLVRVVNEELGKRGASAVFVARLMTARGYPMGAQLVREHRGHAVIVPEGVAKTSRDMALLVRDKAADMFENGQLDLAKRKHASGIGLGLKAQAELNRQTARTNTTDALIAVALMFAGGRIEIPERTLLDDGIIDGDAIDVTPDDDE